MVMQDQCEQRLLGIEHSQLSPERDIALKIKDIAAVGLNPLRNGVLALLGIERVELRGAIQHGERGLGIQVLGQTASGLAALVLDN